VINGKNTGNLASAAVRKGLTPLNQPEFQG